MKYKILTKKKPERKLLISLKKRAGRNFAGRITVRHRGGGSRKCYRTVDFGEILIDIPAKVIAIEYDPNRTAFLCLLEYQNKEKRYRIAAKDLKIGDEVIISEKAEIKIGNRMRLKNIPVGTEVFNIELEQGRGGKLVKGAGTSAKILAQEETFCLLDMPSSEVRKVSQECYATIGQVCRTEYHFEKMGKAGRKRLKGWRPVVRGIAMNPVDHPHGGGEGRSSIGLKYPKTPWGKPALGVKTRKKNKWTNKLIIKRRKKKKRKK